jgi:hypothetical protein
MKKLIRQLGSVPMLSDNLGQLISYADLPGPEQGVVSERSIVGHVGLQGEQQVDGFHA